MRVLQSGEIKKTCQKCKSVIGMFAHEICTVSGPGPYDDFDSSDPKPGTPYWKCPACKHTNYSRDPNARSLGLRHLGPV